MGSKKRRLSFVFLVFCSLVQFGHSVELTFELLDNAKDCFHEIIQKNETAMVEFQVVTGGSYDVDVTLEGPNKELLYQQVKSQYDYHRFVAPVSGEYTVCFSNEFSTFSHKLVYMDFKVGEEEPLPGISAHATALTQLESSAVTVHNLLNNVSDHQTHYKLREAQGRKSAEELNERVLWWSIFEALAIVSVSVSQVFFLKNFFSEKRPIQPNRF